VIKQRFDNRAQVQAWFEENYIFQGVNPVLTVLERWKAFIAIPEHFSDIPHRLFSELPVEQLSRVSTILGFEPLQHYFFTQKCFFHGVTKQ